MKHITQGGGNSNDCTGSASTLICKHLRAIMHCMHAALHCGGTPLWLEKRDQQH
jgi:hypothetical protein